MMRTLAPDMFRKILKYCVIYDMDFPDIILMSDVEFYAWFEHVTKQVDDEVQFKLDTGWDLNDVDTMEYFGMYRDPKNYPFN